MATFGHFVSSETRLKISRTLTGKFASKQNPFYGRKHSPETIKKLREARLRQGNPFKGKRHSLESRLKNSLAHRGEKSRRWKGGINNAHDTIRKSLQMRLWREEVFKRDQYTCTLCGVRSGNGKTVVLNAHHIKPFALYPKLRFVISNGKTLCEKCHKKTDTFGWNVYWRYLKGGPA